MRQTGDSSSSVAAELAAAAHPDDLGPGQLASGDVCVVRQKLRRGRAGLAPHRGGGDAAVLSGARVGNDDDLDLVPEAPAGELEGQGRDLRGRPAPADGDDLSGRQEIGVHVAGPHEEARRAEEGEKGRGVRCFSDFN